MSLLESLVEYLVKLSLCDGDGVDCYRDFMPEAPDNVVVLHEYSSDGFNPFTTTVHRSVQVMVRNSNAEAARDLAIAIYRAFVAPTENLRIDFSDTLWGQVYVRQTPFKLWQDESDRVAYCFNLGITTNILE